MEGCRRSVLFRIPEDLISIQEISVIKIKVIEINTGRLLFENLDKGLTMWSGLSFGKVPR